MKPRPLQSIEVLNTGLLRIEYASHHHPQNIFFHFPAQQDLQCAILQQKFLCHDSSFSTKDPNGKRLSNPLALQPQTSFPLFHCSHARRTQFQSKDSLSSRHSDQNPHRKSLRRRASRKIFLRPRMPLQTRPRATQNHARQA